MSIKISSTETVNALKAIFVKHKNERICVIGTTCCGKTTLLRQIPDCVDMDDALSAVPAFLALVMMPLTYSISNGIGIGAIAYVVIALFTGKYTKKDIVVTVIALLFALRFAFVYM